MVSRRLAVSLLLVLLCPSTFLFAQTPRKKKTAASAQKPSRTLHMKRAFVASVDLKPMAKQLLENRTPLGYASVEDYARKHSLAPANAAAPNASAEAAALAWLVLGYAHFLDKDYANALAALDHTTALQPLIGDYLDWLRASSFQGLVKPDSVIATLEGYDQKYPDSLNLHDVHMLYAHAVTATGDSARAAAYLEKHRQPYHADLELLLGHAYVASGAKDKAADIFRHLYFDSPLTLEAEAAAQELRILGEPSPSGSFDQHHARAEALLKGKRYQEAVSELSPLVEQAPPEKLTDLQLDFAGAMYHTRKRDDARRLFEGIGESRAATIPQKAQALYFLAEIARDQDDHSRQVEMIGRIRDLAPASSWLQDALLSAGNMHMLHNEFENALPFYNEIWQGQPSGRLSAYTHWKSAWLNYRMGKKDEAARLFDEQLALYPNSNEVPAAIYWRARVAEEQGKKAIARAYYQKLSDTFRHYYYANLGRDRLPALSTPTQTQPNAVAGVLDKLPAPPAPPKNWDAPGDSLRAQRSQLLANGALYDFAVAELQAAAPPASPWLAKSIAGLYEDQGTYIRAIETMKRAFPGYFSVEIDQVPRPVWEALFPRPFWPDLKKSAQAYQLDPDLVASLIRQESEFNPKAVSRANAMGLMQLLPTVGRSLAKEIKLQHFSSDELLQPGTNMTLGTRYFKRLVDHYDGQVEYALAAYNAGENRVEEWRKNGNFKDKEEFVESIPFTETREYVQAILRNSVFYKLLYGKE